MCQEVFRCIEGETVEVLNVSLSTSLVSSYLTFPYSEGMLLSCGECEIETHSDPHILTWDSQPNHDIIA